jgi:hypothetical protein
MPWFGTPKSEDRILAEAEGLKGQNFDRQNTVATNIMVDGTAYYALLPFRAGDVVTNLHVAVNTAGATLDLSKMGLYDTSGNRLAVTADLGTAFESTGAGARALTSAYTVTTTGGLYIAVIVSTNGGTMPTLIRGPNVATGTTAAIGSGARPFGTETGQTDLDATATIGTTSALAFWMGWS